MAHRHAARQSARFSPLRKFVLLTLRAVVPVQEFSPHRKSLSMTLAVTLSRTRATMLAITAHPRPPNGSLFRAHRPARTPARRFIEFESVGSGGPQRDLS